MNHVTVDLKERSGVVTITNEPTGYMNEKVMKDLEYAIGCLDSNDALSTIIVTGGVPGIFVKHWDLAEVEAVSARFVERKLRFDDRTYVKERHSDRLFRMLERSAKITIAAINGTAMGIGCELALACDLRIAQEGSYFIGLPEIKIGMLPGAGGTQRLTRLVGPARALELMIFGRRLTPQSAKDAGLVNEVVPDSALERALTVAGRISRLDQKALAHIKRLVYAQSEPQLYASLDLERSLFFDLLASPESLRLMRALIDSNRDFQTLPD
jgi:enoyl-CoA hydratase